MEAYILKTLKKIRKETPRRLKQLLTVCDLHIGIVVSFFCPCQLAISFMTDMIILTYYVEELTQKSGNGGYETLPSKYFEPLQWACESKIPRLMDIAIDALHYMMGMILFSSFQYDYYVSFDDYYCIL